MKRLAAASVLLALLLTTGGCMTWHHASYQRDRLSPADSARIMTKDDVIALATAKVSDRVIIDQIDATGSVFDLTTQDIVDLARAGVSDSVIGAMINAEPAQPTRESSPRWHASYSWYAYPWFYPWYGWYSWYPGFYSYRYPFRSYHPVYHHRLSVGTYHSIPAQHGRTGVRDIGRTRSSGRHR